MYTNSLAPRCQWPLAVVCNTLTKTRKSSDHLQLLSKHLSLGPSWTTMSHGMGQEVGQRHTKRCILLASVSASLQTAKPPKLSHLQEVQTMCHEVSPKVARVK